MAFGGLVDQDYMLLLVHHPHIRRTEVSRVLSGSTKCGSSSLAVHPGHWREWRTTPLPEKPGSRTAGGDDFGGMNMMDPWALGPEIRVTGTERVDDGWLVSAVGQGDQNCPDCGERSTSRHNWHHRRLQDLPVQGLPVSLDLRLGRWRCRN